ncbi:hypothetical protein EJB05_28320, partial [Eragrostis curvula]
MFASISEIGCAKPGMFYMDRKRRLWDLPERIGIQRYPVHFPLPFLLPPLARRHLCTPPSPNLTAGAWLACSVEEESADNADPFPSFLAPGRDRRLLPRRNHAAPWPPGRA